MVNYEPYKEYFNLLGKDKTNIVLIHNFISSEDLVIINKYLDSKKDDDEFMGGKDLRLGAVRNESPEVAKLIDKYEEKTYALAYSHFTEKYNIPIVRKAENSTHFVKWVPGMNSGLHCDCETPEGGPSLAADFYKYNISILMYPNDSYTGGEITFPDYGIIVKPQAGDIIMFPGNGAYKHTVERVTSGTRYTMPSWYSFKIDGATEPLERKSWTYKDSVQ